MGADRKTKTINATEDSRLWPSEGPNCSVAARNLHKNNLGGVIFRCKHSTMKECLGKLLFGLPYSHFSYVRNIEPSLPLFLFNYSDRTMHGIFEAAGHGQLSIDPYAWTEDGRERTQFSSQVRAHVRMSCQSLSEKQFKGVIQDNYYSERHFWFELDHSQTKSLMSLFRSSPIPSNVKQAPLTFNKFDNPSVLLSKKKKTIGIQEKSNMTSLLIETKNSTKLRNMNKFELLGAHDEGHTDENVTGWGDQYQLSNKTRASSSAHDEMNFKERAMNWGDCTSTVEVQNDNMGDENNNNLGSPSIDLHLNGDNGKLLVQHKSAEPSKPDIDKVMRKLKEISDEQAPSSLFSKDYKIDSSAPSIVYNTHKFSKMEESIATSDPQSNEGAGKSSLKNDDVLHKPKNAIQQRQIYRDNMHDGKCKGVGFTDGIHGAKSLSGENLRRQTSLPSVGSTIMRNPRSEPASRFNICKTESVGHVVLKLSLLEINRAKRKEAGRPNDVPQYFSPRPGMILLKNYISHGDQVRIIQECKRLGLGMGGFYKPGYSNGAKMCLHMMCLGMNWDPQSNSYNVKRPIDGEEPPKIPVEFINLVNGSIEASHNILRTKSQGVNAEAEIPKLSPDICIVNFYDNNGRLGLHQDKDESQESLRKGLPVVSFSLGDTAVFLFGDDRDDTKADKIILESGDVLIFGGSSRQIFHGVFSIFPNTAPKQLIQDTCMRPGRLNLTFRQY